MTKQRRSSKKELHYAFFHCIERSLSCGKILFCGFYIPFPTGMGSISRFTVLKNDFCLIFMHIQLCFCNSFVLFT